MDTLDSIWSAAVIKNFVVQNNESLVLKIDSKLEGSWYRGVVLRANPDADYTESDTVVIVSGINSIWTVL